MRFQTILAAVADPADRHQPAVDRAVWLAKAVGARLVLFHAAFEASVSGRPFFDSKRLARSRGWLVAERMRRLEARSAALRREGLEVDVCVVWEEPAHEAIIRGALREKADLVIAARHVHRPQHPPQLRLTDWELMRLCPRPLLLTRAGHAHYTPGPVLAALDPNHTHDKPARLDAAIAEHAVALAEAMGADCHAVHCVPDAKDLHAEGRAAQAKQVGQRMRERMTRIMKQAGADTVSVHVLRGSVADTVPPLTRKLSAPILVMGIVSRRWLKRLMVGDTAETLIHDVPCDVLLVKPEGFRLRLGRSHRQAIVLPNPHRPR